MADAIGWRPRRVMRNAIAILGESDRLRRVARPIDVVIPEARDYAHDRARVAEQDERGLKLGSLERGQPIATLYLRVHELAVRYGSETRHSGNPESSELRVAEDHELPAHAHDLPAIGVEVDLAIEGCEAC